jgi:glucose/arabinose dehydrogenase
LRPGDKSNAPPIAKFNGYQVVFVPFSDGHPNGDAENVITGFLTEDGKPPEERQG